MLDLALLRRDPERVRRAAARRAAGAAFVDEVLERDATLRAARTAAETLQSEKNALTASISKAADRGAEATRLRPEIAALDARIGAANAALPELQERIDALLSDVPNLLDETVPDGAGEDDNVLVRTGGERRDFTFAPKPHWEIGEALGIIDFERATKLSGSRFSILRGAGSAALACDRVVLLSPVRRSAATRRSCRRSSSRERRCGRRANSRSSPMRCSKIATPICS